MKTMKWTWRLVHACAVPLALGIQAPVQAAAISIISSGVTVHGQAGASSFSGSNSGNTTGTTEDGSTWSSSSSGSITTTGASLSAVSKLLGGTGDSWPNAGYSEVSLTSVFQPLTSNITFKFTGSAAYHAYESWINYSLIDLTSSMPVESTSWKYEYYSGWTQDTLPYTANLSLNVNHQYQLQLLARSTIGDFRGGYANLDLQIVPEPAPAAIFAMGLAGMVFRRSRNQA